MALRRQCSSTLSVLKRLLERRAGCTGSDALQTIASDCPKQRELAFASMPAALGALDAFAAAEAAVAAVIGDDAPFPHFDARQGHLPGPDRQATRSVLEALPPPPPALAEAIKTTEQWTYARAMVLERWCASIKDEAVGEALAPHVHALVAVSLPPAPLSLIHI